MVRVPVVLVTVRPATVSAFIAYGTAANLTLGVISPSELKLIPRYKLSVLKSTPAEANVVTDPNETRNIPAVTCTLFWVSVHGLAPPDDAS